VSQQDLLSKSHGPGHFNDPDMLIIGNFGLSYGQSQAQMALWSIMAAPLIMSVDLRTIEPWAKDILQNKNLLAINQDKLGIMGLRFAKQDGVEMWRKPLQNDYTAFVMLNQQPYGTPTKLSVSLNTLGLIRYPVYNFYESFTGDLLGQFKYSDVFNASVNPSGSVLAFWAEPASKLSLNKTKPVSFIKS
jgi:alpha-N-acetylgalactosaminidase